MRRVPSPPTRRQELVGGGLILAAAVQFGAVVGLGKVVTDGGLPVGPFLSVRFLGAAVLLALLLGALRQPLAAAPHEGWRLAGLGVAGYAVESGLFFLALRHATAPAATLLFFTYPVWVSLLAAAAGRGTPTGLVALSLVSAVAGAAIVVVGSGGVDIHGAGILLAFGSSLAFALYLLGAESVLHHTNSITGSMWVSMSAGGALAVLSVATGTWTWPAGARQWAPVLFAALFTAGAFFCLFAGLRRLGAVRTAIVSAAEPLAASAIAVIFLGEPLRPPTIVGGVFILAGAVAASVARAETPGRPEGPARPPVP